MKLLFVAINVIVAVAFLFVMLSANNTMPAHAATTTVASYSASSYNAWTAPVAADAHSNTSTYVGATVNAPVIPASLPLTAGTCATCSTSSAGDGVSSLVTSVLQTLGFWQ